MQHKKSVMNDLVRYALAGMVSAALVACGGGGGNAGSTDSGNSGGNGNSGGGTETPVAAATLKVEKVLGSTGEQVVSLSASEVGTVHVKLTRTSGSTEGARVDFSDSEGKLVFSPTSALTNANGEASVEVKANPDKATGVATIAATATLIGSSDPIATSHFLEIKQDASKDPQTLVAAINSTLANPADKSIVIAGSGGTGRSETAQLTLQAVDAVGAPVRGATVEFSMSYGDGINQVLLTGTDALCNTDNPRGAAPCLLSTETTSNANGEVVASVMSGTAATPVVVRAQLKGRHAISQTDTVTVTTGVASSRHLDLSASHHVVDLGTSGDSSTIGIMLADANGNPVADNVAVVTTTDFGVVGTSNRGGCLLENGRCSVEYKVQNPRPADGEIIHVVASARVGDGTLISDVFPLRGSYVSWVSAWDTADGGNPITAIPAGLGSNCEVSSFLHFGTPAGTSAPTGSTIAVRAIPEDLEATIVSGNTVENHENRSGLRVTVKGKKEGAPTGEGSSTNEGTAPTNEAITRSVNSGTIYFTVTSNNKHQIEIPIKIEGIPGCDAVSSGS